ncbi:hypothetical protein RRG08_054561 [Elysia crispata]|uniref:Integrase catalytic domain-containing protein n=1 Tax=Elysia crispata TaxID=231223 RepID=A0AAE1B0L9_9GAST|nr:hypothetical protein RRG08_054559 [Elysia crispata]KAK3797530.1 hypothetical protein RRG08_054561 [Elysia crispata]
MESRNRGPQFTSALWNEVANKLGIQVHRTTAYHPQSNGLVERFHRTLKAALKARLQGPRWTDELPWVLLGLRTVPKEDLDTSSAELVYGEPLTVPGVLLRASISRTASSSWKTSYHTKPRTDRYAPLQSKARNGTFRAACSPSSAFPVAFEDVSTGGSCVVYTLPGVFTSRADSDSY